MNQFRMTPLFPVRHRQLDFFVCDVFDTFKDDMASMEHPVFSMSTKPDRRVRKYEHNGNTIEIFPPQQGLATIHDKDILLYLGSQIIAALNRGEIPSKRVRFIAYDLLVATNRKTDGRAYERLKDALDRLAGTRIKTNIETNVVKQIDNFGIIDAYGIVEKSPINNRMVAVQVKLSDWFYNALLAHEVLTISSDYFRLRKPIERRLYELARKHCGQQKRWSISLEVLLKKLGTTSPLRKFRFQMKELIKHNHLPDYRVAMVGDMVTFTPRKRLPTEKNSEGFHPLKLRQDTYEKAKKAAPSHDVYVLEVEWRKFWEESGSPELKNADAAFIGFCKKRHERRPCR